VPKHRETIALDNSLFHEAPRTAWLEKQRETRPWLQWTPQYGLFCDICKGRNKDIFATGLKKTAAYFADKGAGLLARHDGSGKASVHPGRWHREALALVAKESFEKAQKNDAVDKSSEQPVPALAQGATSSEQPAPALAKGVKPLEQPVPALAQGVNSSEQPVPALAQVADSASIVRTQLMAWMQGLYWAAKTRLSLNQMRSFQAHEAFLDHPTLKTHHSNNSLKDGLLALYTALKEDLMDKLGEASVWSLMLDGVTEPVKQFNLIVTFVERYTGKLRTEVYDLVELSAGVILKWDDVAPEDLPQPEGQVDSDFKHISSVLCCYLLQALPTKTMWWLTRDGEGCLAGHRTGLSAQLKAENKFLVDHHCDGHLDQLAHKDAESAACGSRMKELADCMEDVGKFLEKNPGVDVQCRRRSVVNKESVRGLKVPGLSGTRWIYKARQVTQYRRGLVSRMQVFSKRAQHKKVKKDDRNKVNFLLDKQRRWPNLYLAHLLEDYLGLKFLKNQRLQSRGISLGQPAKEASIFKDRAQAMFPQCSQADGFGKIVGGSSTKSFYEDC
jgi:hypothetical protein